jgi:hypothetical protein
MDDADRLKAMQHFLSALRLETEQFRLDRRLFADMCEKNPSDFTKQFLILNTLAGKNSPDFDLGICHAAGMVAHVMGPGARYIITMSPRQCSQTLMALPLSERQPIVDFAIAYAKECRV